MAQVYMPEIISPAPGAALQGTVSIIGTTDINNFSFYEVAFAYDEGEEPGWFELISAKKMIRDGELAAWDTTTIADGAYMLRLRVHLENGDKPTRPRRRQPWKQPARQAKQPAWFHRMHLRQLLFHRTPRRSHPARSQSFWSAGRC